MATGLSHGERLTSFAVAVLPRQLHPGKRACDGAIL